MSRKRSSTFFAAGATSVEDQQYTFQEKWNRLQLKKILEDIFGRHIVEEELDNLVAKFGQVSVQKEGTTTLMVQGDESDSFFVLAQGQCEVWVEKDGISKREYIGRAGDSFGAQGLLHNKRRTATVLARPGAVVWKLPKLEYLHVQQLMGNYTPCSTHHHDGGHTDSHSCGEGEDHTAETSEKKRLDQPQPTPPSPIKEEVKFVGRSRSMSVGGPPLQALNRDSESPGPTIPRERNIARRRSSVRQSVTLPPAPPSVMNPDSSLAEGDSHGDHGNCEARMEKLAALNFRLSSKYRDEKRLRTALFDETSEKISHLEAELAELKRALAVHDKHQCDVPLGIHSHHHDSYDDGSEVGTQTDLWDWRAVERELLELKTANAEISRQNVEYSNEIETVRTDIAEQKLREEESKLELRRCVDDTQTNLRKIEAENEQYQRKIDELIRNLEHEKRASKSATAELAALRDTMHSEESALFLQLSKARADCAAATSDLLQEQSNTRTLKAELVEARAQRDKATQDQMMFQREIEKYKRESELANEKSAKASTDLNDAMSLLRLRESDLAKAEAKAEAAVQGEMKILQSDLMRYQKLLKESVQREGQLKESSDKTIAALREQIEQLSNTIDEKDAELQRSRSEIEETAGKLETVSDEQLKLQTELEIAKRVKPIPDADVMIDDVISRLVDSIQRTDPVHDALKLVATSVLHWWERCHKLVPDDDVFVDEETLLESKLCRDKVMGYIQHLAELGMNSSGRSAGLGPDVDIDILEEFLSDARRTPSQRRNVGMRDSDAFAAVENFLAFADRTVTDGKELRRRRLDEQDGPEFVLEEILRAIENAHMDHRTALSKIKSKMTRDDDLFWVEEVALPATAVVDETVQSARHRQCHTPDGDLLVLDEILAAVSRGREICLNVAPSSNKNTRSAEENAESPRSVEMVLRSVEGVAGRVATRSIGTQWYDPLMPHRAERRDQIMKEIRLTLSKPEPPRDTKTSNSSRIFAEAEMERQKSTRPPPIPVVVSPHVEGMSLDQARQRRHALFPGRSEVEFDSYLETTERQMNISQLSPRQTGPASPHDRLNFLPAASPRDASSARRIDLPSSTPDRRPVSSLLSPSLNATPNSPVVAVGTPEQRGVPELRSSLRLMHSPSAYRIDPHLQSLSKVAAMIGGSPSAVAASAISLTAPLAHVGLCSFLKESDLRHQLYCIQ